MMRLILPTLLLGITLLCSCQTGEAMRRARRIEVEQAWPSVSNQISLTITDEGVTDIGVADQGVWHNVRVRIENHSPRPLHLVSLKQVSDYVQQRNPQAICYRVESFAGRWEDTWRGLEELGWIGKSASVWSDHPAGEAIEFRAPVPAEAPLTKDRPLRVMLRIYLDPEGPGREFHSNEIKLPR